MGKSNTENTSWVMELIQTNINGRGVESIGINNHNKSKIDYMKTLNHKKIMADRMNKIASSCIIKKIAILLILNCIVSRFLRISIKL